MTGIIEILQELHLEEEHAKIVCAFVNKYAPKKRTKPDNLAILKILLAQLTDEEWKRLGYEVRHRIPRRLINDESLIRLLKEWADVA